MGERYGTPNESIPHRLTTMTKSSAAIPMGPKIPPASTNKERSTVIGSYRDGTTNVQIAESAAAITTGVLRSPALTAASPTISAATRLTECPIGRGSRRPASRTISSRNVTSSASMNSGKGVACSPAATLYSISSGSSSGVKVAMLTKTPCSSTARKNAAYFISRTREAKYAFSE